MDRQRDHGDPTVACRKTSASLSRGLEEQDQEYLRFHQIDQREPSEAIENLQESEPRAEK